MPQQILISQKTKEEESIEFLIDNEPPEGYMGCFSGGKDSVVIKNLAKEAGVKVEWYYTLMPDPPELIQFILKYHSDVKIIRPEYSFWAGIVKKCPPTKRIRWCCDVIKEKPSDNLPLKHRILGIRAEESSKRAMREEVHKGRKKQTCYYPIFRWKEWEIWDYIERQNIPYCSLYDEGFSRLGCICCPWMSGRKIMGVYRKRWPAQFRLFEKKMREFWYTKGRAHAKNESETAEEFIQRWYDGI